MKNRQQTRRYARYGGYLALALAMISAAGCSGNHVRLATHADTLSYAIGVPMGEGLKQRQERNSMAFNLDSIVLGARQAYQHGPSLQEEMRQRQADGMGMTHVDTTSYGSGRMFGMIVKQMNTPTRPINFDLAIAGLRDGANGNPLFSDSVAQIYVQELMDAAH